MVTWSNALVQFEGHLRACELADNTVVGYLHDTRSFVTWLEERDGPDTAPIQVTPRLIEAYKSYLQEMLVRSPASINRSMQSLRKFGRFAVEAGICEINPAQGVDLLEDAKSTPKVLTEREAAHLLEAAEDSRVRTVGRDRTIVQLLLETGIRVGELVRLQVEDVNLNASSAFLTVRGQGRRATRRVPLGEPARQTLRAYLNSSSTEEVGSPFVFPGRHGKALSVRTVQQIVTTVGRAAGLDVSARTLRDTYAASLWRSTGDLNLLTERLGHARPEAALKYLFVSTQAGGAST